jgi:glycosyltransferase involved in cell wall biosynthesis
MEKRPSTKKGYNRLFREADLFNFISEGLRQLYIEQQERLGVEIEQLPSFTKDIGVVIESEYDILKNNSHKNPFEIVMVSRFTAYAKRQDILIDAINLIDPKININLTLIGEGPNLPFLKTKVKSLDLHDKIKIQPYMSQKELWKFLMQKNLLCHACDHEGLSKIIIEALGIGIPVLASNVAPLNTYIVDNKNGFLVDNTPQAWKEKIEYLYNNRSSLKNVSKESKEFVKKKYSASINIDTYISQFSKLL